MESRNIIKLAGQEIAAGKVGTWQEILATYLSSLDVKESSRELYKRTLSQYFLWVENTGRQLNSLSRQDILAYKDSLLYKKNKRTGELEKRSSLTANSYIVIVRKFYEWAEAELQYPNIAKAVKTYRRTSDKKTFIKENLSEEKSAELLRHFKEKSLRDYAIVNLMLRTGLRTIEVVRANINSIDYKGEQRVLKVWGKGHEEEDDFVVLTEKAYEPIRAYLEARGVYKASDPLFTSFSHRNTGERLTTRTISMICKEGLKAIGLDSDKFTAHSLRHTAGCTLIKRGANTDDAMRMMRHTSPLTTMRYVDKVQQEQHLKNPAEKLLDEAFNI